MTKKLYFCTSCRKQVSNIEELLFVEESKRGFCSEDCIINFFNPYMDSFDKLEVSLRESLDLMAEQIDPKYYSDRELFEKVLYTPSEIWSEKNDLGEEYFTHIEPLDDGIYYIIICSYYESEPAFVYFKTLTRSKSLIHKYQRQHRYNSDNPTAAEVEDPKSLDVLDEVSLPAEIVEDIDLKKSEYLADLLERRKETDISFEEYPLYDEYLTLTLDDPDDEFHSEDDLGDKIYTFVKSFKKGNQDFFYIAICLNVDIPKTEDSALLPIITFPSIDEELYQFYAVGTRKNTRVTN